MSVAPVIVTVEIKAAPDRAFDIFARQIGRWWPVGQTAAPKPHVDIVIEPFAGGRWFERDADGSENAWGRVIAFDPPARKLAAEDPAVRSGLLRVEVRPRPVGLRATGGANPPMG